MPGSCKKSEEPLVGAPMVFQESFTIQGGLGPLLGHHFRLENVQSHYQEILSQAGKTDADISRIVLNQATLAGVFGDADFDYLYNVTLRVFDENDPNDYIEIAYRDPVPLDPGNTLVLIPNEIDVKRILKKSRFGIEVILQLDRTTQEETPTQINLQFTAVH